ncbi:Uncharacterised protein [Moraxella lacunata]|uniref:HTH cro/C1-type domain-containing protein n=1 Tax=Moraxella lacunata TaxID=477 RepID=A0A378TRG0_MORLA|nr:hypothetical protein [Moraxella lacunata]STZ63241.1 Uncharacterised protein [Moraxella lacunata]
MNTKPRHDVKAEFSKRLKYALEQRSLSTSPTFVRNAFNERYAGNPVSIQTVSNWLSGVAIPSQDKLQTLAHWLSVDSHWLRFGEVYPPIKGSLPNLSSGQIEVALGFAMLTPMHQKIVADLITSLLPNKTEEKS